MNTYEILPRAVGGWRLRLLTDGEEMGGGVFEQDDYAGALDEGAAWCEPTDDDKDRMTREAMESSRAGHTVSHERVRSWVESLNTDNPLPLPQSTPRTEPGA